MTQVSCAQYRYTWAERRLDGTGGGFGVVLQSGDWPTGLQGDPRLRDLLTNVSPEARRESPETAVAQVTHLRVRGGSLLVAKRPVGTDGAGRPGNYSVHALYDASGTLGALDLHPLVDGGTFVLEREVDIAPNADAPPVTVWASPDWRTNGRLGRTRAEAGRANSAGAETEPARYGDEPLRYAEAGGAPELLLTLCRRLPADLVNQLEFDGPLDGERSSRARPEPPAGGIDRLVAEFAEAVELGGVDQDLWWERRGQSAQDWAAELQSFVLLNQPIRRVPDALIWKRWDAGTDRAKAMVTVEILKRPNLSDDATAIAEMGQRPDLLNEVLEAGIKGRAGDREAAARWVAAAGTDEQVVDLAVELRHVESGPLALPLLNRLQQQEPDQLPGPIAAMVAANLDGAYPLAPFWVDHCLRLLLAAEPTCAHPEQLVEAAGDDVLEGAVRRAIDDGVDPEVCWVQLDSLDQVRRARIFAGAGPGPAGFLLTRELGPSDQSSTGPFVALYARIGRTLGWAEWSRTLPAQLSRNLRVLRIQRTILLVALAVALIAVVILALTGPGQ
ncbi:MAG TPA: hypothetical protein VLJ88_04275 [Propionibacteriaceae bacterium]|nr:hypothetical protein [Propionibacteriaceae bacterium]